MFADKIIMCKDDPKEKLLKYIEENFKLILPFEVHKGYRFQIRIKKEKYDKLSKKTKDDLRFHQYEYTNGTDVYDVGSEELRLWQEENYWSNCDAYIFDYRSRDSYILNCRCEYGYEGLEESFDILFFDEIAFPPLIYKNMGADERRNNFKEIIEK